MKSAALYIIRSIMLTFETVNLLMVLINQLYSFQSQSLHIMNYPFTEPLRTSAKLRCYCYLHQC